MLLTRTRKFFLTGISVNPTGARKFFLAYPTRISMNPAGLGNFFLHTRLGFLRTQLALGIVFLHEGCKTTLVHDISITILTFWRLLWRIDVWERSRTELFLIKKCSYSSVKLIKQHISKSKCNCRRKSMQEKRIHNGSSMQIENSVTRGNCSPSFGKPRDAEQLPLWRNFQSAPHNH